MSDSDDERSLLLTALNRIDTLDELVKLQQEQIDELGKAVEATASAVQALVKEAKSISTRLDSTDGLVQAIMSGLIEVMGRTKRTPKEVPDARDD